MKHNIILGLLLGLALGISGMFGALVGKQSERFNIAKECANVGYFSEGGHAFSCEDINEDD